jgi:hypothetical protein
MNIYFICAGFLVSVDSYMNLQVALCILNDMFCLLNDMFITGFSLPLSAC